MGANLTKEYPSTWDEEGVKKWKKSAAQIIKTYYLCFRGSQFDVYKIGTDDERLLTAKICFAIYGPPTVENAEELWNGYETEKQENANEILKAILKIDKDKKRSIEKLLVGIIAVACKQEDAEYVLPLFSVFTGNDPTNASAARSYVDTQKRTYSSWEDWKSNNTMPMLKYAFPRHGFFSCSGKCSYEFDSSKDPDIEFATSPACNLSSRMFGTTDIVAGVTSFGCGIIGVASMFTPIGPAILLTSTIAGGSSAIYGTSRAVVRVYDKSSHGESLTDLESFTMYISIAATPLHYATFYMNTTLVQGAVVNGRIFSSSMRMFATVLNFSTLGIDGVMIGLGIANLVDKYKKEQLNPLDILQFSMSVFFFTNTLIQPKMASSIIQNAQESHIQNYANNMQDADAQATFNKFLNENKEKGTITDNSKIIRTINRIEDPNGLFAGLKDSSSVKIGGRKGKTLLVSDQNQATNRIQTNVPSLAVINQGMTPLCIHQEDVEDDLGKIDSEVVKVNGEKEDVIKPRRVPLNDKTNTTKPISDSDHMKETLSVGKSEKIDFYSLNAEDAATVNRVTDSEQISDYDRKPKNTSLPPVTIKEEVSTLRMHDEAKSTLVDFKLLAPLASITMLQTQANRSSSNNYHQSNSQQSSSAGRNENSRANDNNNKQQRDDAERSSGAGSGSGGDEDRDRSNRSAEESTSSTTEDDTTMSDEISTDVTDDENISHDESESVHEEEPSGEIICFNDRQVERRIRMIVPENALLENQTLVYPENAEVSEQARVIAQHFRNRTRYQWFHIRELQPLIQNTFDIEIDIFVVNTEVIYQDRRGNQGNHYHASHVNVFHVNPELLKEHETLYWILVDFISQTENMPVAVNHPQGIGGEFDRIGRQLIYDRNMNFDDYMGNIRRFFRNHAGNIGINASDIALKDFAIELQNIEQDFSEILRRVREIFDRNFQS